MDDLLQKARILKIRQLCLSHHVTGIAVDNHYSANYFLYVELLTNFTLVFGVIKNKDYIKLSFDKNCVNLNSKWTDEFHIDSLEKVLKLKEFL